MRAITSYTVPVYRTNIYNNVTIIILAANISYGMRSFGPKALLTINNKETLLEYQINLLRLVFPKADIILVVGFYADKIIKKCPAGVRIIENKEYEDSNEAEQIRLGLNCTLTDNVLVMKDDIVFNYDTLYNIEKNKSYIIYDSHDQINRSNVGVNVVNKFATHFTYESNFKWSHIAYLMDKELTIVKALCNNKEHKKLYFFEILNLMLNKIGKISAIEPDNMKIIKIDNSRNLDELEEE